MAQGEWKTTDDYRWHVLICSGEKCGADGGQDTAKLFASKLRFAGLQLQLALKHAQKAAGGYSAACKVEGELWRKVKITRTGCLRECDHGPMVVIYPGGAWYARVTPEQIDQIVKEHLLGGRPVSSLLHFSLEDTSRLSTPEGIGQSWTKSRSASSLP